MSRTWASPSLRGALIVRLVSAMLVIGLVTVTAAYVLGKRYANLAYDRALSDDVMTLAGQLELRDGKVQVNLPPLARNWLLANEGERVLYRVVDLRDGSLLDGNGDLGERPRESRTGALQFRDVSIDGAPMRVAWVSGDLPQTEVPVLVEVAETLGRRERVSRQILVGSLLLFALSVVAVVAVVWQGTGSALAPLRELTAEAGLRTATALQPLEPAAAPVEVRGLIEAINQMMLRVATAMRSQSHFIANAAHQLRTPLAGLQLQAQLALDQPVQPSVRTHLLEIEAGARRATHLIEQLLTLAQAEGGGLRPLQEAVDLVDVAGRVIERHLPAAVQAGIDLGFEGDTDTGPTPAFVTGNAMLIGELLSNLVDNAIRHAAQARMVTVRVATDGDRRVLSVSDDGQGLPAAGRERLFERFSAADQGRGGAGLGLSIVKEIADLHRAVVSSRSAPGQGTDMSVSFPAAARPMSAG